jgi:hypothetical protein
MRQPLFIAATLLLLAFLFRHAASAPIALVDTWRHWKYGEWIWEQKQLPAREPLDAACTDQDKPFVDTEWLGEVVGYLVISRGGERGISLAAGLVEILKTLLLLLAFRRVSGSPWLALLGAGLVQLGLWSSAGMFRPQLLGELCGAAMLLLVGWVETSRPTDLPGGRASGWLLLLPVVFVLWANLDGSFLVGLVFLGLPLIGCVLEGKPAGRLALVAGLCAAAVCINPYGPRLIDAAITSARLHFRFAYFAADWQPPVSAVLPRLSHAAWTVAVSTVIVVVTLRFSPKRFSPAAVLLLLVFGLAAWFIGRLLPWWLMVCTWVLQPHWTQIVFSYRIRERGNSRACPEESTPLVYPRRALIIGMALAITALLMFDASRLAGRKQDGTPIQLAEQLRELINRRPAIVFAPLDSSDYLLWRLPAVGQLFLYNRIEVFALKNWQQYDPILNMRTGVILDSRIGPVSWRKLLDQAGVDVVALSGSGPGKEMMAHFLNNKEPGWQLAYVNADVTELIAERKE